MNVSDTEIAWSILQKKGYQRTFELSQVADICLLFQDVEPSSCVMFVMFTGRCCSSGYMFHKVRALLLFLLIAHGRSDFVIEVNIKNMFATREKAEQTIWNRLQQLTAMKRRRLKSQAPMKIGILGELSLYPG